MIGRVSLLLVLLLGMGAAARAQSSTSSAQHYALGLAAMGAHDPAAAISHFEQTDTKEGRAWLAVALMMESRAPGDRYVERAFAAAAQSRAEHPADVRPRAEIAAALQPATMVITFLVAEHHAYAWAFDRDTFTGYPLPSPAELAAAVNRINGYRDQGDHAGIERVAEDLVPALLGPITDRLPSLTRLIFVMDGPLRRLPIGELPAGNGRAVISQTIAISTVDDAALVGEAMRVLAPSPSPEGRRTAATIAGVIAGLLLAAAVAVRKKRLLSRRG